MVASASPGASCVHGREVETRPIKGPDLAASVLRRTRRADELLSSAKDRAENIMIVDLLRNDLGRVCEYGSVRVPAVCRLESFRTVHHLVSEVRGRLRVGMTPIDLLRAAFPGGSVTGAPKVRAMEIITELEQTARGSYCGSLGYLGFDGNADTSILIRTFTAGRGWFQFPVGGGIVADSVPEREYEETWHKAEGLLLRAQRLNSGVPMILEGIVTTVSPQSAVNVAPMGPRIDGDMRRFLLRPFPTSQTCQNLRKHGEGVLHVTDAVLLLARAAVGKLEPLPEMMPAAKVRGFVLTGACRYFEFRVPSIDDSEERVRTRCETVHVGRIRDFFGFNRGKHAVVEAAILATRVDILPLAGIAEEIEKPARGQNRRRAGTGGLHVLERLRAGSGACARAARMIRVVSGSRLHFGVFSFGGGSGERFFGGAGMMIDAPAVVASVEPASAWSADGPRASRALDFARSFAASFDAGTIPPHVIHVEAMPPEHAGLGSGTQLGLAVARALAESAGVKNTGAEELAAKVARGQRSALGIHGFTHGGFLVEAGKRSCEAVSPLVARVVFPEEWRLVLAIRRPSPACGPAEIEAFRQLQVSGVSLPTDALCRLVLLACCRRSRPAICHLGDAV